MITVKNDDSLAVVSHWNPGHLSASSLPRFEVQDVCSQRLRKAVSGRGSKIRSVSLKMSVRLCVCFFLSRVSLTRVQGLHSVVGARRSVGTALFSSRH